MKILIRMNLYSIIIMSVLFMLISCAEEGPYKMGQLVCSVNCVMVTPNEAIVRMKVDSFIDSRSECLLIDRPLYNNESFIEESNLYVYGQQIKSDNTSEEERIYLFKGLKPNTTYYLLFNPIIKYNEDWRYENVYYYPEFSFTTKKDGEDTDFGDFKLELVNNNDNNCTVLKIITPYYYFLDGNLYASTSPDFKNAVKSDFDDSSSQLNSFQSNIYISKFSPILEKEKYYFKFEGDLLIMINYDKFINNDYIYDNDYMWFENVSIQIPGVIDLSSFN